MKVVAAPTDIAAPTFTPLGANLFPPRTPNQ